MTSQLRIAQVAPPAERVPPTAYGGTERIVYELVAELVRRGHAVTTFASGDSSVPGEHVPTVPKAMRPANNGDSQLPWTVATMAAVLARAGDFDVIHSHLDVLSPILADASPVPVVATFHGRLDDPAVGRALAGSRCHYVAISRHQAFTRPDVTWADVIHHGLTIRDAPFERRRGDGLAFVGRMSPEKGVMDAIGVAMRTGRPLRIAAKLGPMADEQSFFADVVRPALEKAGSLVEFVGELDGPDRDELFAASWASLMPSAWPEPFGLVAIESLACGTPVIARRVGGIPEIVREGVDGFFGDDVEHLANLVDRAGTLDRQAIRGGALERFSASRMVDRYEALYRALAAPGVGVGPGRVGDGAGVVHSPAGNGAAPGPANAPLERDAGRAAVAAGHSLAVPVMPADRNVRTHGGNGATGAHGDTPA